MKKDLNAERLEKMRRVAKARFPDLRICLYDIKNEHNIAAIIRTCDFFGVQNIDIINEKYDKEGMPINALITKGAHKWMDLKIWRGSAEYVNWARKNGFEIYLTTLSEDAADYSKEKYQGRIIVVLGNEKSGIKDELLIENAAKNVIIMPRGFSQSLNVSVSAGIILSHIVLKKAGRGNNAEEKDVKKWLKKWIEE